MLYNHSQTTRFYLTGRNFLGYAAKKYTLSLIGGSASWRSNNWTSSTPLPFRAHTEFEIYCFRGILPTEARNCKGVLRLRGSWRPAFRSLRKRLGAGPDIAENKKKDLGGNLVFAYSYFIPQIFRLSSSIDPPVRMEHSLQPSPAPSCVTNPPKTVSLGHTHGWGLEAWYLGELRK